MNKAYRQEQKDRTALILICSSYGLIGDMNNKIIELAKSDITDKSDIFVIGEKGKDILRTLGIRFFKSYDFEDDVKEEFVRGVLEDIKDYTDIKVYYEEFISVSEQNPKKIFLNFKDYSQKFNKKDYSEYLFEPSFKEILEYLESIMVSMMFTQILYESHLSQYAIRMVMMGESSQKASDILLRESLKFSKAKRELSDNNMKVIFTNFLKLKN
jgi:F-type H+-transporting ATPase subunit gamma